MASCSSVCNPQYHTVCSAGQKDTCNSNSDADLTALLGSTAAGQYITAAKIQKLYDRTRVISFDRGYGSSTPEPVSRVNISVDATKTYYVDEGNYISGNLNQTAITEFTFDGVTHLAGTTIVSTKGNVVVNAGGTWGMTSKHLNSGDHTITYKYGATTSSFIVHVRNIFSPGPVILGSHITTIKAFVDGLNLGVGVNTGSGYDPGNVIRGTNMATIIYAVQAVATHCHCVSDCYTEEFGTSYCNCNY